MSNIENTQSKSVTPVAATTNDLVLNVGTVNGSGSQSANNIVMKTIFRMGIPVGGKNLFPSNIAGLPTWFTIRANKDGYTCRRVENDIVVAMNPDTIVEDLRSVRPGGYFIYNSDLKFPTEVLRDDVINYGIPFKQLVDLVTDQIKIKKLLTNMVYVGVLAELMGLDQEVLTEAVRDNFGAKKATVIEVNMKAIETGRNYVRENIKEIFKFKVERMNANANKIIIDGNSAAAIGLVFGGCSFVSWYPITPSSSVAESFQKYAELYRKTPTGENKFVIIQAEDELAAMGMVLGASWAGARAMTTTSGPGISLMAEFAGYSYFAEIPAVIWNVQRVGPSTGLPTRTMQGDIQFAHLLSHGDTKHPLLLPANASECFEFGQTCFDLAERLQTLVFVMSDLDIGMNFWPTDEFQYPTKPYDRGKVLNEEALEKVQSFHRYKDTDGDAIPYRTLPGTRNPKAPFFTRGSGHNDLAQYTEKSEDYVNLVDRLTRKWETAKTIVPAPIVKISQGSKVGVIAYGSTDIAIPEAFHDLKQNGLTPSYLRLRSVPFAAEVQKFLETHEVIYVVEQNRDGQMLQLLRSEYPLLAAKMRSVLHYDGLPIHAKAISEPILHQQSGHPESSLFHITKAKTAARQNSPEANHV
jgi:2-oxoglutarate ferredoxin oxidoreductase subunit alpha